MKEELELEGRCMCGAVKLHATGVNPEMTVCHCSMCRRWSAGPFMEVTCQKLTFENDSHVGVIRSSEWAERGFCNKCGSVLFYHVIGNTDYQVSVGLFDDHSKFRMTMQVFIDDKPSYYDLANDTKTMTSEQAFAAYAPAHE